MTEFLRDLIDSIKDEDTHLAVDGSNSAEFFGYIDSGSYMLNAVLSGSIYGGVADNKITALAGQEAVGKSFIALSIVKGFQQMYENSGIIYYDTEAAITKKMMSDRGIDVSRVVIAEPDTIEKFKTHCLQMIDNYMKMPESKKPRILMVLDSLGNLPSNKELEDSTEGKNVRDMTRAMAIRSTFRTLTLKLARAKIPLILTNHTYDVVGAYFPTKEMGGGGGIKYAASSIAFLSKSKDKEETSVVGVIVTASMYKSRLSKENQKAQFKLSYKNGLDRYYGLLDLAEKYDIIKKGPKKYEFPDGRSEFQSRIYANPEAWFTKEILDKLDEAAKKEYAYGLHDEVEVEELDLDESTTT